MRVIIDASNVAHSRKDENERPRLKNILEAAEELRKLGYEPVIIADASLKHEIDDKEKFKEYIKKGEFQQVPPGTNADHFILKLAEKEDAKILSNDAFREYFDEFQDINSKRIPYNFKDDKMVIGRPSKPKKVKNILQRISTRILREFERKGIDYYKIKRGKKLSGIAVAKDAIDRIERVQQESLEQKLEGIFMKLPLFDKFMKLVEEAERTGDFIIFVLVNPQNYRDAVKYAGNIAVTVSDRLKLDHSPLVAVRNDIFIKKGHFELNILYSDEVMEESPYNINIVINDHDYSFVKKNSRNIASTIAARIGCWRFPIVSVKPSMLMENPGEFDIVLEEGGSD